MTFILMFLSVGFLAYANGANDNFKGVATLYGSGAARYRTALIWSTVTTFLGSICALYWAQTLLIRFSGKGLAPDSLIHSMPFMASVAAGAGMTVILATRLGFPVSTTHALLGALSGGTLASTMGSISLSALGYHFILPLLLSPIVSLLLAMAIYVPLKKIRQRFQVDEPICLCIESNSTVAAGLNLPIAAATLPQETPLTLLVGRQLECDNRYDGVVMGFDLQRLIDVLHFCSAGLVCFARGLNDTPKIAALLLLTPELDRQWSIGIVAVMMGLGGVLNARRVAETMSRKITSLSQGQGLSANLTTSLLVIFASQFGMPVSTTHVSVGALFGIGLMTGRSNGRMMTSIVLSWLVTLPCAAACTAGIYGLSRLLYLA